MSNWYVMRTVPGKEDKAIELMQKYLNRKLWNQCRKLSKQKLFRTGGQLLLNKEQMFPGYIFIQTEEPEVLQDELCKSRRFPILIGNQNIEIVAVDDQELRFLKSLCGEQLHEEMGLSKIQVDEAGDITQIEGVLKPYAGQITKKRLRKRYVLASVELLHRKEEIQFGVILEKDQIVFDRAISNSA